MTGRAHRFIRWTIGRWPPLVALSALVAFAMTSTMLGYAGVSGDLRGTLLASERLVHFDISGLYTPPTGLIAFPGAAFILLPAAVLIEGLHLGLPQPGLHDPHPAFWAVAGPYEIALSSLVIFAVDSVAQRAGVSRPRRLVLIALEGVAIWNVSIKWGHPEDAVAVALLVYAASCIERRPESAAWLAGTAVVIQPLVLLALPIFLVAVRGRIEGFLVRASTPTVALLGAALIANWRATLQAVGNQPNWPSIDHPTPWIVLSPRMNHGAIAAGPARAVAVLTACAVAAVAERKWRSRGIAFVEEGFWWIGLALALRSLFEPVMVPYYIWPPLAFSLLSASRTWPRLVSAGAVSGALTFLSQASWRGEWGWWSLMVGGIAVALVLSRPPSATGARRVGTNECQPGDLSRVAA